MRRHGPFKPHRMDSSEMGYTAMPFILEQLKNRFRKL